MEGFENGQFFLKTLPDIGDIMLKYSLILMMQNNGLVDINSE